MKKDKEKSTFQTKPLHEVGGSEKGTPPAESDNERIEMLLRKTSLLRSAAESLERDTEEAASHTTESVHKGEDRAAPGVQPAKRCSSRLETWECDGGKDGRRLETICNGFWIGA